MEIQFTKMHGLGNDFVVIDAITQNINLTTQQIQLIANRHFGVGCDQLLLVEKATLPQADFRYRIFNADGGEVAQCGNGARCFARFVQAQGLTTKNSILVETNSGLITLSTTGEQVTVDMGEPNFTPQSLPFLAEQQAQSYPLKINNQSYQIGAVSVGNPHAVIQVRDVNTVDVQKLGAAIEQHTMFPERVNVGFMQIINTKTFKLRVFERGVGETLACGTGACAAMAVGRLQKVLGETVTAQLKGGKLNLTWQGAGHHLMMTGPATTVFHGHINID